MNDLTLVFKAEVCVFDEEALRLAASVQARKDGLGEAEWANMRCGAADDLVMLFDPGLILGAGFEIRQSSCETLVEVA